MSTGTVENTESGIISQPTAHASSELLGEVVVWSMRGSEMLYTDVLQALDTACLPREAARELSPRGAFTRACKELKKDRVIDKVSTKGGVISFQFTQKHLVGDKFEHDYECMVYLDADSGKITCPENEGLADQARQLFAYCNQTRNAQDVTRITQKLFKEHADLFGIDPHKGVAYFVPEQHRDFTTKIDRFLNELGGGLHRFPVPVGTETGNQSVQSAVQGGLQSMLADLEKAVDEWDTSTRAKTIEASKKEWEAISYKVGAYAHYLSAKHTELEQGLEAAKQRLVDKIFAIDEEKAFKAAAETAETTETEEATELAPV